MHSFLTDSWVTVELTVTNPNAEGRDGRVVVFYAHRPDQQYARDIWVPTRNSSLRSRRQRCLLPLHVEKARLIAKVEAPSRRFTVSVHTKNGLRKLHSVQSPIDPVPIDIVGDDLLLMDEQGGLNLVITVSEPPSVDDGQLPKWDIQALELEVVGRTLKLRAMGLILIASGRRDRWF